MTPTILQTAPIFRIFDAALARAFYVDYLGFAVDWEHRFEPTLPLYMQVSLGALTLHLSEHHGDASPAATAFVRLRGLDAYHARLTATGYRHLRPGVEPTPWGSRGMTITDPFGNRIRFDEEVEPHRSDNASHA